VHRVLTTWVVACGEEDTASRLSNSDNMAGSRRTQDSILTDEQFLDTVCSTNLCNQLDHLWIPISSVTTNDKKRALYAFRNGKENGGNEGLAVVRLLENSDLLAKT
jgi:hypothetical protein